MKVNITEMDTCVLFSVEGYLDTTTASPFEEALMPYLAVEKSFVFDFSELEFITSAGLRVVLHTQQTLEETGRTITVRNSNEEVMEVFEMVGFDEFLIFE